jgi:hypothetical protein
MKVTVDTNVLISALGWNGAEAAVLEMAMDCSLGSKGEARGRSFCFPLAVVCHNGKKSESMMTRGKTSKTAM